MKKKLHRRFVLRRETLRTLTENATRKVVGGTTLQTCTEGGTACTEPGDWTENANGISCIFGGACGTGGGPTPTATDPGCGASCGLELC